MIKDKDIKKALDENGWELVRTSGKHPVFEHPEFGRMPVSNTPIDYRAKKNTLLNIRRGPMPASGQVKNDVKPPEPEGPFQFQSLTDLMDLLEEHLPSVDRSSIAKATRGVLDTHQDLTFVRRECTDEDRVTYKLSGRTKYLYAVEDTPANRRLLISAGMDVEPAEEDVQMTHVPDPPKPDASIEVDWHSKAVEFKELFDEAIKESEELRTQVEQLEREAAKWKKAHDEVATELAEANGAAGGHAATASIRKSRIEELEAKVKELESSESSEVSDASARLSKARKVLTEMAETDPTLYKVLYDVFG